MFLLVAAAISDHSMFTEGWEVANTHANIVGLHAQLSRHRATPLATKVNPADMGRERGRQRQREREAQ